MEPKTRDSTPGRAPRLPDRPCFDRATLRTLAAFRPRFEAPGFEFGRWNMRGFPGFDLDPAASAFVTACYRAGWVQSMSWSRWQRTGEARRLVSDPAALERADPDQLSRLLTLLIRRDRFVEGSLAGAFRDGVILRILRRIEMLANDPGHGPG